MLNKLLVVGAAAAFVLAIVTSYTGNIAGVSPEGYSRACTNLALIAVALSVAPGGSKNKPAAG
jgi:hypothetical protein